MSNPGQQQYYMQPPAGQQNGMQQQQQQYGMTGGMPPPPSHNMGMLSNGMPGAPMGNPGMQMQPPNSMAPPPSSMGGNPGMMAAPPNMAGNIPPNSGFGSRMPPPPGQGGPPPGSGAAPKSSVQFFSVAGGNPTPSASVGMGPPASGLGAMPPPPSGAGGSMGMGPPPTGGGMQMPPPPSGMGGQPGINMGMGQGPGMAAPAMYQQQPNMMGGVGGVGSPNMNMPGGNPNLSPQVPGVGGPEPGAGPSLPGAEDMDMTMQCNPMFLRATATNVLHSQNLAAAAKVPIGIVCQPMAGDEAQGNPEIPVVDFGRAGIVRCKKCRTYINPFVSWVDNGRRWKCNICGMLNEVPSEYFSHLDQYGQRRDKDQRPELSNCSVELVAPNDYMVRPPVPPVYFFVIDVTSTAASSGMLQSLVNGIKSSLDVLPGAERAQVGFITFDTCVHFYNLKSSLSAPQLLVVSDISDIILPLPEDLLVNLQESRSVVDALLDSLPRMFENNNAVNNCTGPALSAAKRIVQHIGGKILLFQTSLPSIGEGTLKPRENPRALGTDKEHHLLNAEESWYKNSAVDFCNKQICIDTFLFSGQYTDLATLAVLSKYTGGSTYYYPGFSSSFMGEKFEAELTRCLTRPTGFEAVMRVRATRGLRITSFYGNYYIRGADLLALPNCTSDSVYGFDVAYDEPVLGTTAVTVQAALLYTTSDGERRIRVHTMVLPVTRSVSEFMEGVDIDCAVNMMAKQATEVALKTGLEQARLRAHQLTIDILRAAKQAAGQGQGVPQSNVPGELQTPPSLQLLPLYAMSLMKSLALRGGQEVRLDERAFYLQLCANMSIEDSKVFIYPRLFSLHDMAADAGIPCDVPDETISVAGPNNVRLPAIANLSHERLLSDGIFLMETGHDLFLYIGRTVAPNFVQSLFGVQSLEGIDVTQLKIQQDDSDYSSRVAAVIDALRADRTRYMQLHIIREGDGYAEAFFARYLVEDRAAFQGGAMSYSEYHASVVRQIAGMH